MSAPFLGIYKAIYDYQAQNDEELSINENDLLYLLKKSDFDDWWLVKKRVVDANSDEPQGLVPKTYITPAIPIKKAIALYDYTKQTDEELSFVEGTNLNVYDLSDPNWTLVDINNQQFGFVPGNYIELQSDNNNNNNNNSTIPNVVPNSIPNNPLPQSINSTITNITPVSQSFPPPPQRIDRTPSTPSTPNYNNNNDNDDNLSENTPQMPARPNMKSSNSYSNENSINNNNNNNNNRSQRRYDNYSDDDDDDYNNNNNSDNNSDNNDSKSKSKSFFSSSSLKPRSRSNTENSKLSRKKSISNLLGSHKDDDDVKPVHGDFAWKINEIDGKKKRPGILEIGDGKIYLDIENKLSEVWSISDLINYNMEKKHVFLDFKSPSYSFELHVTNKSSAQAILSILGDMKGLQSQSALNDIKKAQREGAEAASSSNSNIKKGVILYDFDGAASDELTCYEGENVYIINDKKSKEWWMVENSRGKRGVVPSNYVKLVSNKSKNRNKDNYNDNNNNKESSTGSFLKNLLGPNSKSPKKEKKTARERDREERELREMAKFQHERSELEKQRRRIAEKEKELAYRDRAQREKREKIRRADERLRERRMREDSKLNSSRNEKDSNRPNPHRVRTWIDRSGAFKVEAEFLGVQQGKIHLHKLNGVKIAVACQKLSTEDLEYVERLTGTSLEKYKPQISKTSPSSENNNNNSSSTPSLPSRETSSAVARKRANSVPIRADLIDYWFNFFVEAGVDAAVCDRYATNFAQEQVDNTVLSGVTPALMRTLGVREGDILKIKNKIDLTLGRVSTPEPVLTKNPSDPLPQPPVLQNTNSGDDDWATKPAATSIANNSTAAQPKTLTPQITGSIQDLLDVKPMEPTRTGITPVKPVNTIGLASSSTTTAAAPSNNNTSVTPLQNTTTGGLTLQKTGLAPAGLNLQKTGLAPALTGAMPMVAMPTGFMPITMVPMLTGMVTGMQPSKTGTLTTGLTGGLMNSSITGGAMPMTTFGVNSLAQQPSLQQKTGGAFIMPLATGTNNSMPMTSFGSTINTNINPLMSQQTNGMVKLQPTGIKLQKTGGLASIPAMQPTMKTGGGFVPQSTFGLQLNNSITGGAMMNPALIGGLPQTSFGQVNPMMTGGAGIMNPAITGGFPQTSFGQVNPMMTGGLPQTSFGNNMMMNPALTGGAGMMNPALTGGLPQTSFGQVNPMMTGGLPQTSFGNNMMMNPALTGGAGMMNPALTGGLPPTSFGNGMMNPALTGGLPQTSFGGVPANQNQAPLQSQATGFGFGNSIVPSSTGKQANLANATADNPFGF